MENPDDDPPQYLKDGPMKPETDEEKEAREKREWEESELDTEPSKLKIIPRREGPPEVRPFKLSSIGPDFTIGFFGKRRGTSVCNSHTNDGLCGPEGKSFAMRWILWHMRDRFPRGIVFTNTKINGYWQQYLPEAKIFDGYRPGVMAEVKKNQENLIRWMQAHPKEAEAINPYFFVVMDGMLGAGAIDDLANFLR